MTGDAGAGKTTLLKFMWKLVGEQNYEGFDPSKSSAVARSRNFSRVGNLPVVLIESERDSTGGNSKQKAFDFDELKSLYDGGTTRAVGVKTNNNETYEPPFRGSVVIAQNAEIDASEAILSRIVGLHFTLSSHTHFAGIRAARLKQAEVADVSGFIIAATRNEYAVMEAFTKFSHQARTELIEQVGIKHDRVALTHSQITGMLHAMAVAMPLDVKRIEETHSYIQTMAQERERRLGRDHPMVQEFWEMFDYLDDQEPYGINHSTDRDKEIAVNFNHFEEIASAYRQRMPFSISEIKKLLKTGRERVYVKSSSVYSYVSRLHNAGKVASNCKPESYHCWIFKRKN